MSYSEVLLCVYACSSLGIGCEILNRSTLGAGPCADRRLRRNMQAARAAKAIRAAPTPIPMPILAASDRPPDSAAAAGASEVDSAEVADVVVPVVALVGVAVVEPIDAVVDEDDVPVAVGVVDVSD